MLANRQAPAKRYNALTFQERGVAVPFTTPLLGGTRARESNKHRLDLIVRNPAGGAGVYVMPWTGITALCRPTLHDKVLNARLAALDRLTPATIRQAARAIAAEGLAGEHAMAAARTATDTDKSDRVITNHHLLAALVRQVNIVPGATDPNAPDLDARARQTVAWLAPHLGQPIIWAVGALDSLADIMAGIGVVSGGDAGRIPRLIGLLRRTRDEIGAWSETQRNEERVSCADRICAMAETTLSLAAAALLKARVITEDMVGVLRTWARDPDAVTRLTARPEWLLDGWEQVCLIWNYAEGDAERCAALIEIVENLPVQPREASMRDQNAHDLDNLFLMRRPIALNEDWRTGAAVFDLIARNERFRARAS